MNIPDRNAAIALDISDFEFAFISRVCYVVVQRTRAESQISVENPSLTEAPR
jgi:hypothetical protein